MSDEATAASPANAPQPANTGDAGASARNDEMTDAAASAARNLEETA